MGDKIKENDGNSGCIFPIKQITKNIYKVLDFIVCNCVISSKSLKIPVDPPPHFTPVYALAFNFFEIFNFYRETSLYFSRHVGWNHRLSSKQISIKEHLYSLK